MRATPFHMGLSENVDHGDLVQGASKRLFRWGWFLVLSPEIHVTKGPAQCFVPTNTHHTSSFRKEGLLVTLLTRMQS